MESNGKPKASSTSVERIIDAVERDLACDLAGFEAGGADVLTLGVTRDHGLDALDVRIPTTACTALGVRDVVSKARTLATNIAYRCHDDSSLERITVGCS